ncbi:MAG TPA: hypothetical protein VHM20_02450, partial [Gammaproteobacteria bacterium]|nr:hypothetical protein [Gammaproteobacteria bacterium]
YLSSLLNGLTTGVGIKNFSLLFSNDGLYIKYFLSTLSMMIVTYDDCLRQEHTRHFFNKITDFSNIIVEIQNKKLNLASAILFCQKEYLKTPNEQKIGEEIPILNDEEDILVSSKKFI